MFVVARLGVLLLTLAAGVAAIAGSRRSRRFESAALMLSFAGGSLALGVLAWAFLAEDWRFATVVGHARPDVPWTLRVSGIWAGPEGSLLLWATMLSAAGLAAMRLATSSLPGRILAATVAAYGLVVLTEADPFERLVAPPGAGNGLQPVLEHPAMLWHPPVLYLGLIGLLVPAALSVESRSRSTDAAIAWTLPLALCLLTAGLATGSNWAYVELGWGGYWAWDPIENAGLVAWLAGAALLHRLGGGPPSGDDGPVPRSFAVVAVVPGIAAIWATTITRTGVLNSVHSFADRPTLRLLLLTIAVAFTAGMIVLAIRRRPVGDAPPWRPGARSAAGFAVIGGAVVVVAAGTYEPALERLFSDESFLTSGRFYSMLLWPLALAAAVLRVRAGLRRSEPTTSTRLLAAAVVGALAAMVVVTAAPGAGGLLLAAAGGAVVGSTLAEPRTTRSGGRSRLAHIGIGVLMIGVAGTTASVVETVVVLVDTDAATSVGVVTHRGVDIVDGGATDEAIASVDITADGRTRTFHPKLVSYRGTGGQSAEVDTDRGWPADVQVVLVDAAADRATYRVSRHPRISLVWLGAALMTIGLAITAAARRSEGRRQTGIEPALR